MPAFGGRKHHGLRSSVAQRTTQVVAEEQRQIQAQNADPSNSSLPLPQHPSMPDLPRAQNELFFECTLFLYSMFALVLQHINLYKTMWWVPKAYVHHKLKFHLIDPYVFSCIGLILGRRVVWTFLRCVRRLLAFGSLLSSISEEANFMTETVLKLPMLIAVVLSFSFSAMRVVSSYPLWSLVRISYPMILYLFLFHNELAAIVSSKSLSEAWRRLLQQAEGVGLVPRHASGHACSQSPSQIRAEVELLTADLSLRSRHSFFTAFTVAFFSIYIPACFAPQHLYVDFWWVGELLLIVFLTALSHCFTHLLPLHYCDLLHRSVSHLGLWEKMETPLPASLSYQTWSETQLWPEGAVVKHGAHMYRAVGLSVAAEPGNTDHYRIYKLGSDPLRVLTGLFLLTVFLLVVQFLLLVHATDWQHILTLLVLVFANYFVLFRVFRDKIILSRVYNPSPEDLALYRRLQHT